MIDVYGKNLSLELSEDQYMEALEMIIVGKAKWLHSDNDGVVDGKEEAETRKRVLMKSL